MYVRKDIQKSLKMEAKMAEHAHCYSWSKLFLQCAYLLRQNDKEIARLRAEIERLGGMSGSNIILPLITQENENG